MDVWTSDFCQPSEKRLQCDHYSPRKLRGSSRGAALGHWAHRTLTEIGYPPVQAAFTTAMPTVATHTVSLRLMPLTITLTSPDPQLQFTASFAPAATPCELHPTSAHPPHSTSHHRECCPPVRLTLCIPERMVHA